MIMSEKIKQFMHKNNLTQSLLADRIGIKQSTISSWVRGKTEPSFETLKKIQKVFGVSFTDDDAPYIELNKDWVEIKFYEDIRASAGCGIDNHCEGYELLMVDRKLLNPRVDPAKHHGIRVQGDSMEPTFKDGDVIFVEAYNGDFVNNRIYIIKRQGDIFIKRVKKSGDTFDIISDNADYENYKLERPEFEIIGRVV